MRCGELLALKWENVDLNEGVIRVQQSLTRIRVEDSSLKTELRFQPLKTVKSRRSIPIPQSVIAALKSHKSRQNQEKLKAGAAYNDLGLVFCTELGQPIDPRNLTRTFNRLLERAGIPKATLHSMRHSYATRLLEMNEHPKVVQELMGHSQISMTLDTYSHVMPEIKQAAAAKLDDLLITKSPPAEEGHK
jgi:integrase